MREGPARITCLAGRAGVPYLRNSIPDDLMAPLEKAREKLAILIEDATRIVAFTGAGISTECGIPDFRSADSAWKRHPPMPFDEFMSSEAMQKEAWRRKFAMDDLYAGAMPGRGHMALARLYESGKLATVITQNIDGLHQASGISADDVIELHGNGTYATCLSCGVRYELSRVRQTFEATRQAPRCLCGGVVKSATISFGQPMPGAAMRRAHEAARKGRSLPGHRFVARCLSGCRVPAACQRKRSTARDSQSRPDTPRRPRRPLCARRHR